MNLVLQGRFQTAPAVLNGIMNSKALRFFRKYHKWPGIFLTLFILFFALSGIVLNHRGLLSGVDISRKWLPRNYRYNNWNLASVKGSVSSGEGRVLLYGNIGVWETDTSYRSFTSLNKGFPEGIDNRKVNSISVDPVSGIYAGTLFGLYRFDSTAAGWTKVSLPATEERIVKVLARADSLWVMTRSNLMVASAANRFSHFVVISVPAGVDMDNRTGLFKTLWVIHSGEIYGLAGKLIVDFVGNGFLILCLTGLVYFFAPYFARQAKDTARSRIKRFNLFSLRWHNRFGTWLLPMLILTTLTGMLLRPPLLIPIANSRVGKIPYTELDNPNPWFDRFRDIAYDESLGRWILATSEGIYYSDDNFHSRLRRFNSEPPVSVMGINVLEITAPGKYLVGSFSGIYLWDTRTGAVLDYFTKTPYTGDGGGGPPFGNVSVAGYLGTPGQADLIFDYGGGAVALSGKPPLSAMPQTIVDESPISLWNTALEIHTGRIFEPLIGNFYILVVPLVGLASLFITVTGFFAWWLPKRRARKVAAQEKLPPPPTFFVS